MVNRSISADIHVGVVCGLGAAAAAWTIAGSPALLDPACLAFVVLAAVAAGGGQGIRDPLRALLRATAVASALVVYGLGAALLVGEIVTARAWIVGRTTRGPLYLLGLLHSLAVGAMRILVPGLAYLALGGTAPIRFEQASALPLAGGLAASWATGRTLAALGRPDLLAAPAETSVRRALWLAPALELAAVALALGVAWVDRTPEASAWLLIVPALSLLAAARPSADRRSAVPRPGPSDPARRAIAEALAMATTSRGRGDLAHLDRVEGLAIDLAAEIGVPAGDREALAVAAVLHEIDLLALPPVEGEPESRIEPHPALGAEILDALPVPRRPVRSSGTARNAGTGAAGRPG